MENLAQVPRSIGKDFLAPERAAQQRRSAQDGIVSIKKFLHTATIEVKLIYNSKSPISQDR